MAVVRIGISGWRYPEWRGVFYPEELPQRRELEYAARFFNSIEINGSFSRGRSSSFCAGTESLSSSPTLLGDFRP